MPKEEEKRIQEMLQSVDFLKNRNLRESLIKDPELAKIENLKDRIIESQIIVNGKNEIIRLPEIETVYHSSNAENAESETETPGTEESGQENRGLDGRRIVDLVELGRRLWCGTCREVLSLSQLERECRRGLGSILLIRCHKCFVINEVTTDKMHDLSTDRRAQRFNVNTDLASCILNTGFTVGLVNKIFGFFKIPVIHQSTYKKFEEEFGEEEIAAIKAKRSKHGLAMDDDC